MSAASKWILTDEEKDAHILALTDHLPALRTQAGISQEELSNVIGVSRQTYSAIERSIRRMSWSTYLALLFFFDHHRKTHKMIRRFAIFPQEMIARFNDGADYSSFEMSYLLGERSQDIIDKLDRQALYAIRSMVMVEYARCAQLPSDVVIRSFGGIALPVEPGSPEDMEIAKAIKAIRRISEADA